MDNIYEISSDSEDTIIMDPIADDIAFGNEDVSSIVQKYILEQSCSKTDNISKKTDTKKEINYDSLLVDDGELHVPLLKRLKKPESYIESADTLHKLSAKYQQISEKKCKALTDSQTKTKKQEKATDKALKKSLALAYKNSKPEECMKFICVYIDTEVLNEKYGENILQNLKSVDVKYRVESHILPHTISWKRTIHSQLIHDDGKLVEESEDQETDEILLILNCNQFLTYISNNSIMAYIESVQQILGKKKLSLAIYGVKHYLNLTKNEKNAKFRSLVSAHASTSKEKSALPFDVTRLEIEMIMTEVQVFSGISYRMVETDEELALMVAQFTKSIAQLPYKRQQKEKLMKANWYQPGDNKDCVKVDKDGNGLQKLWKQSLTIFPMAQLETAEVISEKYTTPTELMEGYDNCKSVRKGETLLQDIPIRRAAGPLSNTRKVGPVLSKKIYRFFTSLNGDDLL